MTTQTPNCCVSCARTPACRWPGWRGGWAWREPAAVRAPLTATVLIQIEPRAGPAVLARLDGLPGVSVVHTTSGRFDLLAQVSAQTTEELDTTIDRIGEARGVRSSESLIHLATKIDRAPDVG